MFNIIKYNNANALEATWLDVEGKQIASIAYADTQIDLLRADVAQYGGDISLYEDLIAQVEADFVPEPPQPTPISTIVTMRQARLALLQSNLLDMVNQAIASGNEADKITWEFSTEIARDFPLVQSLKSELSLSEEDLDNLFILANSL